MMCKVKYILLMALCQAMIVISHAQQKDLSSPWRFQSIINVGLLEGQNASAFQLQTINGAQYKTWFTGVGLGLDYYRFRTIPLFLDIRKEFGRSNSRIFIYAEGGISFSWVTDQQKLGYPDEHFSNGFYDDLGLGYKVFIGKRNAFLISLGYSYKKLTETYTTYYYYPQGYPPGPLGSVPKEQINYSLNRLSIKMGWAF
jgi:hypothetical protein